MLKAYEVEYHIKLLAYGNNAKEAHENGGVVVANADVEMEDHAYDATTEEEYAERVAWVRSFRPVGTPKRSPEDDFDLHTEDTDDQP
jgi:hypothetical protein